MLRVTIRDTVADAVYEGTVYTQTVSAELVDGSRVEVEDPTCEFEETDIGSTFTVDLRGQSVQAVRGNPEESAGVVPGDAGGVDVHGRVDAVAAGDEHPIEIDVGDGSLRVDVPDEDSVEVGDWITVRGARLFLRSVETEHGDRDVRR